MLFDLRGRGRRRTVQAIYLTLAILMGGGLVLFGIGGATSGGLIDAISGNSGGGGGGDIYAKNVEKAQTRVNRTPADAAAWAALARAQAQVAGVGKNFDQATGTYTKDALPSLRAADRAWQRYLALKPAKVDGNVASIMVQLYVQPGGLNSAQKAVAAQEYVIDSQPASSGLYANLAVYAYAAGQTRKGDLASQRAIELAPADQKNTLKQTLDEAKTGSTSGGASGGTTSGGATGAGAGPGSTTG
ncbi:hypothetical protein [Capillimicrobium parvum]|uniref:Uncharacterized protein n=1 Tax=Capillimicrobium parvum TaxID=2884022 RepID=A0A9E6Y9W2_9ACTN|nr:hypothetical protein [Capillimicrobium parvum]UGS39292.1 hypothetical protein DSM104329_05727 [Capillimicrobium parvum]